MSAGHGNLQKYQNPNPLQQALIRRFLRQVESLTVGLDLGLVLDVGCAEGFVARHLVQVGAPPHFIGIDVDVASLQRGATLFPAMARGVGSALALPFPSEVFDLVLCTEVLEHLLSPRVALRELKRVTRKYVLLSVPHEPWFRTMNLLRGKHLRRWGNDPEHLQNWTARHFTAFVAREFEVVSTRGALPWWIVLGRK